MKLNMGILLYDVKIMQTVVTIYQLVVVSWFLFQEVILSVRKSVICLT